MKIGIHHHEGSFSDHWIQYCINENIDYKIVDCYKYDIIQQLEDCDALMWNWHHGDPKAVLFSRQLIYSVERMGKLVFPSSSTCWHYDDKVGQKYLLESLDVPFIPTYVFYDKAEALRWINEVKFPKVFKLRGGASSTNVQLVKNNEKAKSLVIKAFSKGFSSRNRFNIFKDRLISFNKQQNLKTLKGVVRGIGRVVIPTEYERLQGREKGYVYFQDFYKSNSFDTRVVVIADKCFTIRRYNRENDFRASGSHHSAFAPELFDKRCLRIALETAKKLRSQSTAFDFIFDDENNPRIVEISYAFVTTTYPGYWDSELNWHEGDCNCQYVLMENMVRELTSSQYSTNFSYLASGL